MLIDGYGKEWMHPMADKTIRDLERHEPKPGTEEFEKLMREKHRAGTCFYLKTLAEMESKDFKPPKIKRVDFPSETLHISGRPGKFLLMTRSWYGGHRPDYDYGPKLTNAQALYLHMRKHEPAEPWQIVGDWFDCVADAVMQCTSCMEKK